MLWALFDSLATHEGGVYPMTGPTNVEKFRSGWSKS
jgi:hypothetical protein